ncbi:MULTISPECIES: prepilin peptidase [unclassified Modestobacter]
MSTAAVTAAGLACLAGGLAGNAANRLAGCWPWPAGAGPYPLLAAGGRAVRPPVVEFGTAALCVLVAVRMGPRPELPAYLLLAMVGVLLVMVDLRHQVLPDRVLLPALVAGIGLLAAAALAGGEGTALLRALGGAAVLFLAYLVLALASPGGLGMGDVKLAGLLGLYLGWVGWGALLYGALAGFALQALIALALVTTRRVGRSGALPFGPAMLVGALLTVLLADP